MLEVLRNQTLRFGDLKGKHWCKTLIKGMQDWGKTKTNGRKCTLGWHKKSNFLELISSQVNTIPFLYLRHPVKYFCPIQSGSAALRVVIFQ